MMIANKLPASLPHQAYETKQVQENEALVAAQEGIGMLDLMKAAGAAVFEQIQLNYPNAATLLIVCGKGNNGGDGFVIARLAHLAGLKVTTLLVVEQSKIKGDALITLTEFQSCGATVVCSGDDLPDGNTKPQENLFPDIIAKFKGQLIVDCLFGIGFRGALAQDMQLIVAQINRHKAQVLSVDVPSGLCANTGRVVNSLTDSADSAAIYADTTITFIAIKKGLLTGQAFAHIGKLHFADLGLGAAFAEQVNFEQENSEQEKKKVFIQSHHNLPDLQQRLPTAHKGKIGMILAIGGNVGMPGAIRLAGEAALRAGSAILAVCCHQTNQALVFNGRPEMMLAPCEVKSLKEAQSLDKAKAYIIGPGLGQDLWAHQLFNLLIEKLIPGQTDKQQSRDQNLQKNKRAVIDADALHLLSKTSLYYQHWVLTPHPGEAATLLNCSIAEIEADRFAAVQNIALKYGGICVLKGSGSLVSDGNTTWINTSGNAGMATAGMGDVLSGIIAAVLLQMKHSLDAVRFAVYIHGQAADIIAQRNGQRGLLASDLFSEVQMLVN
ncbi:MAG: NAD(P)H-hydrate dehydratase [Alteromonadaceae bacterium]|nr:NAD(P)H-hydrate dehydratase [Alteromonadaceae bacterium]